MSMIRFCIKLIGPPFSSHANISNVSINHLSFPKIYTDSWHFIQESCKSYIRFHCTDFWRHLTFSYTFQCHLSGSVPVNDECTETGPDSAKKKNKSDLLNHTHFLVNVFDCILCKVQMK